MAAAATCSNFTAANTHHSPTCGVLAALVFVFSRDITERHRRLAEIIEMIHTASLVHDDVLDDCSVRRGGYWACAVLGTTCIGRARSVRAASGPAWCNRGKCCMGVDLVHAAGHSL